MTLQQFQHLKQWHQGHRDRLVEGIVWNLLVTLWMAGWVGAPTAWLLHRDLVAIGALALLFAPGSYVMLRRALHRRGWLRCDWMTALR